MKSVLIFIGVILFCNAMGQNTVKCWKCEGYKKVEVYIDPYYCQVCVNWNSEYRRKVACHACRDTRVNQSRRTKIITCDECKGTGRDFAKERRLKEFGSNTYLISTKSYLKSNIGDMQVNSGDMIFRERDGTDRTIMKYSEAVRACNALGDGWRLPTLSEMNAIFNAYKNGNRSLDIMGWNTSSSDCGDNYYWTSTPYISGGRVSKDGVCITKCILDLSNRYNNCYKEYSTDDNYKFGDHRVQAKCVNTNPKISVSSNIVEGKNENVNTQVTKSIQNTTVTIGQNNPKRDPDPRKDFANVFYNPQYTLFDLWSDEPIFPDKTGLYTIYYATNEDKTPRQYIGKPEEIKVLVAYKFKNFQNCNSWCKGIKFDVSRYRVN